MPSNTSNSQEGAAGVGGEGEHRQQRTCRGGFFLVRKRNPKARGDGRADNTTGRIRPHHHRSCDTQRGSREPHPVGPPAARDTRGRERGFSFFCIGVVGRCGMVAADGFSQHTPKNSGESLREAGMLTPSSSAQPRCGESSFRSARRPSALRPVWCGVLRKKKTPEQLRVGGIG